MLMLFVGLNILRMRSFRTFDAQRRRKSLHSTIKRIVLSHLQMVSIVMSLSVPWPDLMKNVLNTVSSVASFSEGINSFECLYQDIDHSDFYNGVLVFTAIGPLLFAGVLALYWLVLVQWCDALKCGSAIESGACCSKQHSTRTTGSDGSGTVGAATTTVALAPTTPNGEAQKVTYTGIDAFVSSSVLLWFIALPSLLRIGSGALKCYDIGGKAYVFIDLEKECNAGNHLLYALLVVWPMILFYGALLPGYFMLRLHRAGAKRMTDPHLMLRWGMLHSGYCEKKVSAIFCFLFF